MNVTTLKNARSPTHTFSIANKRHTLTVLESDVDGEMYKNCVIIPHIVGNFCGAKYLWLNHEYFAAEPRIFPPPPHGYVAYSFTYTRGGWTCVITATYRGLYSVGLDSTSTPLNPLSQHLCIPCILAYLSLLKRHLLLVYQS